MSMIFLIDVISSRRIFEISFSFSFGNESGGESGVLINYDEILEPMIIRTKSWKIECEISSIFLFLYSTLLEFISTVEKDSLLRK